MHDVLVHLNGEATAAPRGRYARMLAGHLNAKLRAFVMAAAPIRPYGPGAGNLGAILAQAERQAADDAAALKARVENDFGAETVIVSAHGDRVALDSASLMRAADLVVVGPTRANADFLDEDVLQGALMMSGRPVIVTPLNADDARAPENIVIFWKDCREAARAVHDSLPLLAKAKNVRLIGVKGEDDPRHFGQAALDRIGARLQERGVKITAEIVDAPRGGVGERLLTAAKGGDLIVMGGYGRWRFSELVFGGVTQHVLRHAETPLLMSH